MREGKKSKWGKGKEKKKRKKERKKEKLLECFTSHH